MKTEPLNFDLTSNFHVSDTLPGIPCLILSVMSALISIWLVWSLMGVAFNIEKRERFLENVGYICKAIPWSFLGLLWIGIAIIIAFKH